ncbi:Kinesin-like protein [Actinidia chinensis var. chinensis]|uniref:Kinesin-like protein n=1 Tax=Actinidia chinensis var. chinensis TaxID=1590841 RepID=A0A2R6QFB6_ACTCC|nr:Kinesin-like protein [Actinidia chinensis var. chinensis]
MSAATCNHPVRPNGISTSSSRISRPISFPNRRLHLGLINSHGRRSSRSIYAKASLSSSSPSPSPWDDKPYEVLRGGRKVYLDEQDVVAFLDPPKNLVPLDPASFNPAAYLWKKIEDVPEERRINLLFLIKPRLISRAWALAGTRYEDPKLLKKSASSLLSSNGDGVQSPEFWNCRTSGGPLPIAWINLFKKAIFHCKDGMTTYGRIIGESAIGEFAKSHWPLYFAVKQVNEVMSTEQPCDLAYEFGDGLLDIHEYPPGFPRAAKHPWPFNDEVVIYIRYLGPGVMVGQAWQEGESLEKLPQKLCGEILMVKDYAACENK